MDKKTLLPVNYYQYRLDVNKYNKQGVTDITQIDFEIAYDFNTEYGFENMSDLNNFEILAEKIKTDLTTYTKF